MFERLKAMFKPPQPAGPPEGLVSFSPSSPTITQDVVTPDAEGWRLECTESQTVRLFEVPNPGVEQCILTYRAQLKSKDVKKRAYLEMWCRLPGRGEFFSKGIQNPVQGTNDWAAYETPFFLKKGQQPDLLKLNLVVEGRGTLWIKDIQVLKTPLA